MYIYIYIEREILSSMCIYIYIYVYTYTLIYNMNQSAMRAKPSAKPRRATKEGQWVLRTPLHMRALVFLCSAWF